MSSRAERRRAERAAQKGEWKPFVPPTLAERLVRHTQSCENCRTGAVRVRGCKWLTEFYDKNSVDLDRMMGAVSFYDKETEEEGIPLVNPELS